MYIVIPLCVLPLEQEWGDQTEVWRKDIPYICKSEGGENINYANIGEVEDNYNTKLSYDNDTMRETLIIPFDGSAVSVHF